MEEEPALHRYGLPYRAVQRLKAAGLRPTQQRVGLTTLLFGGGDRHVSAEALFHEARAAGLNVSLATIYNTLHQFAAVGLLRKVVVNTGQTFFDTNTADHHHFFNERTGEVRDIPDGAVELTRLPPPPEGFEVAHVDVVVHLRPKRA
jgi:Fur family iron response transcriptional regulator